MTEPSLITSAAFADGIERLAASGRLFAALDGADAPTVPERARAFGPLRAAFLYRPKEDDDELVEVAPYLFHVDAEVLRWLRPELERDPALGIFVLAETNLEGLRRHFRRYLVVVSPAGTKMNFRFFDPRVLTTFLDCCTARELDDFYGPASEYGIPTEDGLGALFFKRRVEEPPRRRTEPLLKLRPAQMRAFAQASEDRFADRVVEFLQVQFPEARNEARGMLRASVVDLLGRARGHGFTTEIELTTFVVAAWFLGTEFDTEIPAVAEVLRNENLPASEKAPWLASFTETFLRTLEEG